MGSSPFYVLLALTFLSISLEAQGACYTSIISFGDSFSDTGNRGYYDPTIAANSFPYGETFFHRATGRSCDGRLVIDFIAQTLGLPLVTPYLGHTTQDFAQGVNFAVSGATALDVAFFEKMNVSVSSNYSLGIQLDWFKQLLPSLCGSPSSCENMLGNVMFVVGAMGFNDYSALISKGLQEMQSIVPKVIDVISSTISALVQEGALTFMVPGILPIGCEPYYLTTVGTQNKDDYDPSTGCLTWLNEFAQFHNQLLQNELKRLRKIYSNTTIIYVDYYNVVMDIFHSPNELGFNKETLKTCCGGGGPYNYNTSADCGFPGSTVCDDPSVYVSWDGNHLTEAVHKLIAAEIFNKLFSNPLLNKACIFDGTSDI